MSLIGHLPGMVRWLWLDTYLESHNGSDWTLTWNSTMSVVGHLPGMVRWLWFDTYLEWHDVCDWTLTVKNMKDLIGHLRGMVWCLWLDTYLEWYDGCDWRSGDTLIERRFVRAVQQVPDVDAAIDARDKEDGGPWWRPGATRQTLIGRSRY